MTLTDGSETSTLRHGLKIPVNKIIDYMQFAHIYRIKSFDDYIFNFANIFITICNEMLIEIYLSVVAIHIFNYNYLIN